MNEPDAPLLGRIEGLDRSAAHPSTPLDELEAIVRDLIARTQRLEHELRQLRGVLEGARSVETT